MAVQNLNHLNQIAERIAANNLYQLTFIRDEQMLAE